MRILIADDDNVSRSIIRRFLIKWGHNVVEARNGIEALDLMKLENSPFIAILDWMMPGIDGIEVCRRLRKMEMDEPLYIIMLTSRKDKESEIAGLDAGADDYFSKPFDEELLLAKIRVAGRFIDWKKAFFDSRKALRESETRFRELFDNMSSGVAVYEVGENGEDFVFVDYNRSAERLDGFAKESIIGRSVFDVFPEVESFGLIDVMKRVWKTGTPEHFPMGQYVDQRIAVWRDSYIYKLPSGEIVSVYDDVTERKKAEERLNEVMQELRESHDKLLYDATHDLLTGVYNRSHFMNELDTSFESAKRYGQPFSVCLCDLDHFKSINDLYGHISGDEVLIFFGRCLRSEIRSPDVVGRYGGDEFALFFPGTTAQRAIVLICRIRNQLKKATFRSADGKSFSVSATFGVADISADTQKVAMLVGLADRSLYIAKGTGRDAIAVNGVPVVKKTDKCDL